VVSYKIRVRSEEVSLRAVRVAAVREFLERPQALFAAPDGVVQLASQVVAEGGEVIAIEERAVVRELGLLI
jgi:hypothetical protein